MQLPLYLNVIGLFFSLQFQEVVLGSMVVAKKWQNNHSILGGFVLFKIELTCQEGFKPK
jgi:hypothetical protein